MWIFTGLAGFSLFLCLVSSENTPSLTLKDNIFMGSVTTGVSCPSRFRNQNELQDTLYNKQKLEEAAWSACYKRRAETRFTKNAVCQKFKGYFEANINKLPKTKTVFDKHILQRFKDKRSEKYLGNQFQPKFRGELLLWKLYNFRGDDITEKKVVAEWISCENTCIILGAVWNSKSPSLGRDAPDSYKKCEDNSATGQPGVLNPGIVPSSQQASSIGAQQGVNIQTFQHQKIQHVANSPPHQYQRGNNRLASRSTRT